jgi:Arc/MetJ-type ribon-helix-helix transcriptional regulator
MRERVGEEKLAVRCSPQELKAMDSYVLAGDFRNRSALVRSAIEQFLEARLREMSGQPRPVEGPMARLAPEEVELLTRFAQRVHGGSLEDAIAMCVRYGLAQLGVDQRVKEAEDRLRNAPVLTGSVPTGNSLERSFDDKSSRDAGRHPARGR